MKKVKIPDWEKAKGLVCVQYEAFDLMDWQKPIVIAELEIKQKWN